MTAQRVMAIRIIRGYRTISFGGSMCSSWLSPVGFGGKGKGPVSVVSVACELYRRGEDFEVRDAVLQRSNLQQSLMQEWKMRLPEPTAGRDTIEAIRSVFKQWTNKRR
ncbi:uncharacterized protein LOC131842028 [Achroia grisella]|uniref:uncharacterized protein LOC131842028 n=1 Tax=Achroia grisella TaxID=688607 RepID=UPI0027D2B696|nr:uncharacterized protein LOC131842028 [Achroia grisella]